MIKNKHTTYPPTIFTIFGITGDLSKRKLLPSLYQLFQHGLLPQDIHCVGIAHTTYSSEQFHTFVRESIHTFYEGKIDTSALNSFVEIFSYLQGDFINATTFQQIKVVSEQFNTNCSISHQSIFYLASAPQFFLSIIEHLRASELTQACPDFNIKAKIVIEKPFGTDLASAQALNDALLSYVDEEQIYRMDHYLGRETVQNILLFRFTNPVINHSWDPSAIERIHISAREDLGVEQRALYYDASGALRDMVQSHCLALLTLALMDEPASLSSEDIHRQKYEILKTLHLADPTRIEKSTLRAQYDQYQLIPHITPNSQTETYAAVKLFSSHSQWKHVPLVIETGKRLAEKETSITISFSPCQSNICKTQGIHTEPNVLTIRIQPQEGISLQLYAKKPGFSVETEHVNMDFFYETAFTGKQPSPYERLLHDVIMGDQSLFPSTNEVMEQWRIIQPILDAWKNDPAVPLHSYEQGSLGPKERAEFFES